MQIIGGLDNFIIEIIFWILVQTREQSLKSIDVDDSGFYFCMCGEDREKAKWNEYTYFLKG